LAVYQDDKLLDPGGEGLTRLASVSARMKSVEGVRDVLSLAEVNALLEKLPGNFSIFRRARTQAAILDPDSDTSRSFRDLFAGYTHSADGKVAALVVMLIPQNEQPSRGARP
jgi:hypothetical protein